VVRRDLLSITVQVSRQKHLPFALPIELVRWSHFLRQAAKVDSSVKGTIHHENAETVFG
jgi:hypothetical protein